MAHTLPPFPSTPIYIYIYVYTHLSLAISAQKKKKKKKKLVGVLPDKTIKVLEGKIGKVRMLVVLGYFFFFFFSDLGRMDVLFTIVLKMKKKV